MAVKTQKEFEMRIHEHFYTSVQLLMNSYPPLESFLSVFKKDMFVKNNKVGFQQAVYYLLDIVDRNVLKQKISTWPLYDVRSENEFRNEVMRYVNELNTIYEDANIPTIVTSHLITPGGLKFIKFMCKLAQFVLYQHLQRNNIYPTMLLPVQPSKRDDVIVEDIEKLVRVTSGFNECVNSTMANFNEHFDLVVESSNEIVDKILASSELQVMYESKLAVLKAKVEDSNPSAIHIDLPNVLKDLRILQEKVKRAKLLNSYLQNPLQLAYNGELSSVTDPMRKIRIENGTLNLLNLLESFNLLLDQKCLEVKPTSEGDLEREIKPFQALNQQVESYLKCTQTIYTKSLKMLQTLEQEAAQK